MLGLTLIHVSNRGLMHIVVIDNLSCLPPLLTNWEVLVAFRFQVLLIIILYHYDTIITVMVWLSNYGPNQNIVSNYDTRVLI